MAVQFVLGRSGTGKTSYCVRAIADALLEPSEQPLLFLVPEQATYEAERAILSDQRIPGYHRLRILSFDRLQFLLLGKNTARPAISRIGRQMVIHKILRDNLGTLQIFGSSALLPGFAREMASTITELHQYAKNADDIEGLLKQLNFGFRIADCGLEGGGDFNPQSAIRNPQSSVPNRLSALKFADVALVFRKYSEAIEDKFIDPDAQITSACKAVAKADFIKGARLWVDGFASFTGGEMALLMEVLKAVDQAHMALCLDPADIELGISIAPQIRNPQSAIRNSSEGAGLFEPTARTYREMLERLDEAKVKVLKPMTLHQTPRFRDCPALAHLEQNLFRLGASKSKAGGSVRLLAAPSVRLEIQSVARQILGLVKEKGYRYRDIAVVASDLSRYEQYVRAYFEDYGIPFFIDKRKPLNQHPVVELICAALQAVTNGLAYADVFAYLKTDLVTMARSDVDLLENYCLAFGVDGRDWADPEPWRFQDKDDEGFGEDQIDRIRGEAIGPLLELRQALCPDGDLQTRLTSGEFARVIFVLLDRLHVRKTVSQWIEEAHEGGDPTTADEHRQFFDAFVDIFDALVEIFERQEMTAQDYFGLLASAFSQMTLAFIPPKLDQVLVGSIERSRHPNLKAIFLLGATQKQFPIPLASSGVLTDEDREAAEAAEFCIAPSSTQSLADRQYLAYIAFTRPSQFMCISYPCVDEKGSPIMRSHFIDELQSLFEDVTEEFVADDLLTLGEVQNTSELGELLCSRLGRDVVRSDAVRRCVAGILPAIRGRDALDTCLRCPDGRTTNDNGLAGLLEAMESDAEYKPLAERIAWALSYENRSVLEPGLVKELFGHCLRASATRLAAFAACPYQHFVRYVLDLKPRQEFKLEPLDLGTFYHSVLDSLHQRLADEKESFAEIENDRLIQVLREQIAELAEKDSFISQFVRRSAHNAFLIESAGRVLEECALGICQMVRAGTFRPLLSEVGFGCPQNAVGRLGRFDLPLPEGRVLSLDGKIDRLDVAPIDGRKVALILDYKRSRRGASFDWGGFYHGLDVQLAIYMLAVRHCGAGLADEVAGAVCMPIETTPESATLAELADEERSRKFPYKAGGVFNGTYWQYLDANAVKDSAFYNFYVTAKDQQPYGNYARTNILKPAHFARLLDWARDNLIRLATDVVSGKIEAKPYHRGSERACAFCDYMAVCHFDWQINDYNFLRSVGKSDLIERLDSK
ncbi:MAG: exodeoxyribonuclease V subunit gamma [Phycisphaerae bacterium]|nr:exodeoxyribonuclease V subunit gamma [Phycisphaerae bacterium]